MLDSCHRPYVSVACPFCCRVYLRRNQEFIFFFTLAQRCYFMPGRRAATVNTGPTSPRQGTTSTTSSTSRCVKRTACPSSLCCPFCLLPRCARDEPSARKLGLFFVRAL